ncbi:MAG: CBS domain-containing protein, partial [Geminicoccaceae bacterium]
MTAEANIDIDDFKSFALRHLPLGLLVADDLDEVAAKASVLRPNAGEVIYEVGKPVPGLCAICEGAVEILSPEGEKLSRLSAGDSFGERGLLGDGLAPNRAVAAEACLLFLVPAATFHHLLDRSSAFATFFERAKPVPADDVQRGLASTPVADLMTRNPITIDPERPVRDAASIMRDKDISCLPVVSDGILVGLLTSGDLVDRVLALDLGGDTPVSHAMTPAPFTLDP